MMANGQHEDLIKFVSDAWIRVSSRKGLVRVVLVTFALLLQIVENSRGDAHPTYYKEQQSATVATNSYSNSSASSSSSTSSAPPATHQGSNYNKSASFRQ